MDSGMLIALVILAVVNVVAIGIAFGMLRQKVNDLCDRVSRLESIQNSKDRNSRRGTKPR